MFETGAAELAASRRSAKDLAALERLVDGMRTAHAEGDVPGFVDADLAFHDVIFAAADNRILVASVRPLTSLLEDTRTETSTVLDIREHAIAEHAKILAALRARSAAKTRAAMVSHMRQTRDDLIRYVLGA